MVDLTSPFSQHETPSESAQAFLNKVCLRDSPPIQPILTARSCRCRKARCLLASWRRWPLERSTFACSTKVCSLANDACRLTDSAQVAFRRRLLPSLRPLRHVMPVVVARQTAHDAPCVVAVTSPHIGSTTAWLENCNVVISSAQVRCRMKMQCSTSLACACFLQQALGVSTRRVTADTLLSACSDEVLCRSTVS